MDENVSEEYPIDEDFEPEPEPEPDTELEPEPETKNESESDTLMNKGTQLNSDIKWVKFINAV